MKIPSKWDPSRLFMGHKPKSDAECATDAFLSGHILSRPDIWQAGIVFASPHSGSIYPSEFVSRSKLTLKQLRRNEDIFVDTLFEPAIDAGAPLLRACFPRCFVDVNRAADEIPQKWADSDVNHEPSARTHAGIGVVPTHINETLPIYDVEPSKAEAAQRLDALYHPYHTALQGILNEAVKRFSQALLIDCHSMPGFAPMGARRPDIVLGDRFGNACNPETLAMFKALFRKAGYSVAINHPYAGGFVTTYYGRPKSGIEAIQIEINRDLYLNPVTLTKKSGYDKLARDISHIITQIIQEANPQALAAQ